IPRVWRMRYGTSQNYTRLARRGSSRKFVFQTACGAAAFAFGAVPGIWMLCTLPAPPPHIQKTPAIFAAAPAAAPNTYVALFDPTYSLGVAPVSLAKSSPLASNFVAISPAP